MKQHPIICLSLAWLILGLSAYGQVPKLTENYRHYCFDFNWVDKIDEKGKPLADYSNLSAQDHIDQLVEMKANSLMVFCMSISGYMFYDSKVGERHPTLQYDYLKEMIRLGHEKGIAMELYVPTMWADRVVQQNPSWGMRNPDGTFFTAAYGGYHPDPNSPAADWYVKVIRELIPAYGGDAFFADGTTFMKYGQSEYTVKKFRQEMGRPYPKSLEEDPDWRATLRWEVKQVENYWRKLRDAVKEQDPSVEVTFNGPGPFIQMPGGSGYRTWVPRAPSQNLLTDYAFTEAGSSGEYATWTRGVSYPKPFKVTFLNRYSILDPFDPDEIRARVGRTLAVGGQPYRYDRTSVDGDANRYFTEEWKVIFDEIERKEHYIVGAEPVKYAAVISSEPTMLYRGRSDGSSHATDLIGALKILDAVHIQHDVVPDWRVTPETLKQYQVVILPNTGCMTTRETRAIREYVQQGGSIIATAESSLLNENGDARSDFALADVFGVTIDEKPSNAVKFADEKKPVYIHPGRDRHPIFEGLPPTELIMPGDATYVRTISGNPTARLIADAGTPMQAPGVTTGRAAVHVNSFGEGKSVYIGSSVFARTIHNQGIAQRQSLPNDGVAWTGKFVERMVTYLAPNAPWRLKTSPKIWAGLNTQPKQGRHILHLVNWQPDLPAHQLEVSIADSAGTGKTATMVWPERKTLAGHSEGGSMVYTIPETGPHVMVVLE